MGRNNASILLKQQLEDFGQVYNDYISLKKKQVQEFKKFDNEASMLSLLERTNVVDDFLTDMTQFQIEKSMAN
jgi:hypothetical protein